MHYRYTLDLQSEDGRSLERTVVTPDWNPALAWVHFEGIRAGILPAVTRTGPGAVEPLWDDRHGEPDGEPRVAGFRVTVGSPGGRTCSREISRTYLRGVAHELSAGLIARGVLQAGDVFRWVVSAVPLAEAPAATAPAGDGFGIEEIEQVLPIDVASLVGLAARATPAGVVAGAPDEMVPVFVPQAVLDETMALARDAGDLETGGVLVGALHRDGAAPDATLFIEVTAQVPARHTRSASTSLTFTSDTWAAVHAAIALRRRGEIMLGWWHYHPDFCRLRNCPLERRRECTGASPFFSAEDVHLHATCFPAGHQIALLISDSAAAGGLSSSLFGWSEGAVQPRGFHVVRSERADRTEGVVHVANPTP